MWPVVVAGVAGAWFAKSRAPKTSHKKYKSFGPRTGTVWDVELFPELGIVAVRKNGTVGTFRSVQGQLAFLRGKGDPAVVEHMRKDFVNMPAGPKDTPHEPR